MEQIIGIAIGKNPGDWRRVDVDGNSIEIEPRDFDAIYAGIKPVTIDDQHMIEIPAYYYRSATIERGDNTGKKAIWCSPVAERGFTLHPAFRHHGDELGRFWLGAYQGTPDGQGKLGSQPGHMPLTAIDFPTMQARAAARGDGWMLWSGYQLSAVQMLALIELGTPDAQAAIGRGHVDGGGVQMVDDPRVMSAAWRGITGLWGNVWQMVDGIRTNEHGEYLVWDNTGDQQYIATEVAAPDDGWLHRRSTESDIGFDLGAMFLPSATRDEREESAFGDYCWMYRNAVAYHGGAWGHGAGAGLSALDVGSAASHSGSNVGGRLAKV